MDPRGGGALQASSRGEAFDQRGLADAGLAQHVGMTRLTLLHPLPRFVQRLMLAPSPDERAVLPLIDPHRGNGGVRRPLPSALPEAKRHGLQALGRRRTQLLVEAFPPGLEDLERIHTVAGEGAGFHLGPDRFLAQFIQREHPVREVFDLLAVAGPATTIHEQDQRITDLGMPPGPLPLAPEHELRGVGHFEAIEEGCYVQRRRDPVAQDLPIRQAGEIQLELGIAPAHAVAVGVQYFPAERCPERREAGGHRMPAVRLRQVGPQQLRQSFPPVPSAALQHQVHQQRQVLPHLDSHRLPIRPDQRRLAQAAQLVAYGHGHQYAAGLSTGNKMEGSGVGLKA